MSYFTISRDAAPSGLVERLINRVEGFLTARSAQVEYVYLPNKIGFFKIHP